MQASWISMLCWFPNDHMMKSLWISDDFFLACSCVLQTFLLLILYYECFIFDKLFTLYKKLP
jgi:hypothetical protein